MFDGVARRYDLTNTVLSGGLDRHWRKRTRQCLELRPGPALVLDLAAGTGVSTAELLRSGASAVALRLLARHAARRPGLAPAAAPSASSPATRCTCRSPTRCSTRSRSRSACATSPTCRAALRELARVVRPGGRLVVCEFSRPTFAPFRFVYLNYLMRVLPWIARRVSSNAGGLRLPRRVDPGLAAAGRARSHDCGRRLAAKCATAISPAASSRCTCRASALPALGDRRVGANRTAGPRPSAGRRRGRTWTTTT